MYSTPFSVSEISVFDECQNTCFACAHIYVGCDTIRIITSENDRKPNFDTRSTIKNRTSYVLNTILSRNHEGLARVEVRQNPVSAVR